MRDLEEKWRQKLGHEKVLEEICEELGALGPDTKSSLTKRPGQNGFRLSLAAENS